MALWPNGGRDHHPIDTNPVPVVDVVGEIPLSGVVGISAGGSSHGVFEGGRHGLGGREIMLPANLGDGTTTQPHQPGAGAGWIGQPAERGGGDLLRGGSHTVYLHGGRHGLGSGQSNWNWPGLGDGTTTQRTNPVQVVDSFGKSAAAGWWGFLR